MDLEWKIYDIKCENKQNVKVNKNVIDKCLYDGDYVFIFKINYVVTVSR